MSVTPAREPDVSVSTSQYVARGKDVATTLYSLVKRLPDDVAKYKSLLHYREGFLTWLEPFTK